MTSERFKLAVLNVLAASAKGSATVGELRRDVPVLLADEGETEQLKRFRALGQIDIFQSGLLLRTGTGFEITEAGLSLLESLDGSTKAPAVVSSIPTSPALNTIDDLIGAEDRLKIFDLGVRTADAGFGKAGQRSSDEQGDSLSEDLKAPRRALDTTEPDPTEDIALPITPEQKRKDRSSGNVDPVIMTNSSPSPD